MHRLIKKDEIDDNLFPFIVKRPNRDVREDKKYKGLFTPALERAWAKVEADKVKENCGGRYRKGEVCGFDYSPLGCDQEYSETGYVYRMDCQDESSVTVSMRWPQIEQPVATYRLLKQGEGWVLDGMICLPPDGYRFNMPEPSAPESHNADK